MNDEMLNAKMQEHAGATACDRAEQLVAYLYGETSVDEARSFRQHMSVCASCRDELAAFGGVREMVGEWREAVVSGAPAFAVENPAAQVVNEQPRHFTAAAGATRRRSALAAIREFFALSPLWLQAGSVAAALLVCVLTVFTLARAEVRWDDGGFAFSTGGRERIVEKRVEVPVETGVTQEQVEALRAAHQRELAAMQAQLKQAGETSYVAANASSVSTVNAGRSRTNRVEATPATVARQTPRREASPATQQRIMVATTRTEEEDLPRLYDLLSEVK